MNDWKFTTNFYEKNFLNQIRKSTKMNSFRRRLIFAVEY